MKRINTILSVFLTMIMVIGILPVSQITDIDLSSLFPIAHADSGAGEYHEFHGHYYEFYQTKKKWHEAKMFCENLGGHLLTITSKEEQDYIYSEFNSLITKTGIAIGLTDEETEGVWKWVTDEPFSYSNWDYREPNNERNEDYALMNTTGKWNDGHLQGENWCFICEWDGQYAIKDFSEYSLKIVDDITQKPVKDVTVTLTNNETYFADENGIVKFVVLDSTSFIGKKICVTSNGYDDYECYLSDLDMHNQNVIRLKGSLWVDVLDAAFGKETINGPSIKAFGKEFPLFTVDVGLDLTGIPGMEAFKNLKKANNISIDEATKTIKIMIGLGDGYSVSDKYKWSEDYQAFKEYYQSWHGKTGYNANGEYQGFNNDESLNKYKKIRDKLKPLGKDIVFSANATFCGYAEIDYSSGKCVIKEGGLVMTAEAGLSTDVPIAGIFYATFGIKGTIGTKILWQLQDSGSYTPAFSASLALTPNLGVGAKLISKNVASAEVGLSGTIKGELSLPAKSLADSLAISLTAKVYLKAKLLWVLGGNFDFEFANVQLYPEVKNNRAKMLRAPAIQESDLEPLDRSYAEGNNAIDINSNDVYPYASPKLAQLSDGTLLAFWLGDNGEKGLYNRTTLYYSVNLGTGWSAPVALCENGTADYAPEISVAGNKVHILWGRASKSYTEDTFDIDTALANTELMYSCYENGVFSEPIVVSESTGKYQEIYSIAADDAGKVVMAWVENSENDYNLSEGNNTIYYREMRNDILQNIVTVTENAGALSSMTAGYGSDDTAEVAYTTYDQVDEVENYTVNIGGDIFSDSSKSYVGITYQNKTYYCIVDNELCKYDSGNFVPTGLFLTNDNYKVMSDGSIIYAVDNGFKNELYISYLDNEELTDPVQLTEYGKHISSFDALSSANGTIVFASVDNLNEDESSYPFTTTDLICGEVFKQTDISINDIISYEESDIVPGAAAALSSQVKNNSTALIDSYSVVLKDGEEIVATKEYQQTLLPGQTADIEIDYTIPASFVKSSITVEVSTPNDTDLSNNIGSVTLGKADIQLVDCVINNGVITGIVENTGFDTAVSPTLAIDYFSSDATNLTRLTFEDLAAGEQTLFEYTVPEEYNTYINYHDSNRFILSLSTESEESLYGNNSVDLLGEPIHVTGISQSETAVAMLVDETRQLSATISPANALDKNIIWISDSTDVATVNDEGLVTAVGKGQAIISAISEDGDFVSACTVNVDCDFDYEKINNDTEIKITGYHGQDIDLTVPETLCSGLPVTQLAASAIPETIETILLPSSLNTIEAKAFNEASALQAIQVNDGNDSFMSLEGILYSHDLTKVIRCPRAIENKTIILSNSLTEIASYAFADAGITSVSFPETLSIIRSYAFSGNALSEVTIPENVTRIERNSFEKNNNLTVVNYNATDATTGITTSFLPSYVVPMQAVFYNDSNIETVNIGQTVESLPSGLFVGMSGLKTINIEADSELSSVAKYTFYKDSALSDVYYGRFYKYWKDITIATGNTPFTDATLHCLECRECTWDDGVVTKEPTCVATGTRLFTCTVCEKERTEEEPINPNNHTGETTVINSKTATCSEEGYTGDTVCSGCGVVLTPGTVVGKIAHAWDEGTITLAPTCEEAGIRTFKCVNCSETKTEPIEAIGHDYGEWIRFDDNQHQRICSNDESHIEKANHSWDDGEVTKPAKCNEEGARTYTCVDCGATRTEAIEKVPHTEITVKGKAATCTETGLTDGAKCSECGTVIRSQETIPAKGHKFSEWIITKAATCTETGTEKRVCMNDSSHVETRTIEATGHKYGAWTQTKAPTCTGTGTEQRICANDSSHIETRTVSATGHKWSAWVVVSTPSCTETGLEQRVCKNDASHIETREIAKTAHTDADGDGLCDDCGAAVDNGGSAQESNCVCGKNHTGPFAGIIKFFHKIVYFFKNLFNKN